MRVIWKKEGANLPAGVIGLSVRSVVHVRAILHERSKRGV
jgi:hypothetical protein